MRLLNAASKLAIKVSGLSHTSLVNYRAIPLILLAADFAASVVRVITIGYAIRVARASA